MDNTQLNLGDAYSLISISSFTPPAHLTQVPTVWVWWHLAACTTAKPSPGLAGGAAGQAGCVTMLRRKLSSCLITVCSCCVRKWRTGESRGLIQNPKESSCGQLWTVGWQGLVPGHFNSSLDCFPNWRDPRYLDDCLSNHPQVRLQLSSVKKIKINT